MKPQKRILMYLLSTIDLDNEERCPSAIFSSKSKLYKAVEDWEKEIDTELIENKDYEINEFYLDAFL